MAGGENINALTGAYYPSFDGTATFLTATVTNASQRLGALVAVPTFKDPITGRVRPYNHVGFQLASTSANTVWLTFDNVTVAVAGPPAIQVVAGPPMIFENARALLEANATGNYQVNANTAFQLIGSAASQTITVFFFN